MLLESAAMLGTTQWRISVLKATLAVLELLVLGIARQTLHLWAKEKGLAIELGKLHFAEYPFLSPHLNTSFLG